MNTGLRKPSVINVALSATNTEYPVVLGSGNEPCHGFQIQCRTDNAIRIAYTAGQTADGQQYFTLKSSCVYYEDNGHYLGSVYLRPETASTVAEIIIWQ